VSRHLLRDWKTPLPHLRVRSTISPLLYFIPTTIPYSYSSPPPSLVLRAHPPCHFHAIPNGHCWGPPSYLLRPLDALPATCPEPPTGVVRIPMFRWAPLARGRSPCLFFLPRSIRIMLFLSPRAFSLPLFPFFFSRLSFANCFRTFQLVGYAKGCWGFPRASCFTLGIPPVFVVIPAPIFLIFS